MDNKLILFSTEKNELKGIIAEVLKEELTTFFNKESKKDNRLCSRKEVAKMLGISLPTLHTWTKEGTIKAFRIGNAVRYKAEDVELALQNVQSIKFMRGRTINNYRYE